MPNAISWRQALLVLSLLWLTGATAFGAGSPAPFANQHGVNQHGAPSALPPRAPSCISTAALSAENCGTPTGLKCCVGRPLTSSAPFCSTRTRSTPCTSPIPRKPNGPSASIVSSCPAGDVVFGSLLSLTDQEAELDVPLLGPTARAAKATSNE